jgi:diguanylate cyclase (GGDEF)-like protein
LLPVPFVLIGLGNYWGSARSYSYSVFFILAFVWLGIGHRRWTSLWFVPLAAAAFVAPILLRGGATVADASAVGLTVPVCILVAEIVAWIVESEQRSRHVSQSLARVAAELGRHLHEGALCQSLVDEARTALSTDHALLMLYQGDRGNMIVRSAFVAGVEESVVDAVAGLGGTKAENIPDELFRGEPLVVEDTAKHEPSADFRRRFRVLSYIAIPVMARGSLVGVLTCMQSTHKTKYDADTIAIAEGMAGQASAAFQNARLYEQTLEASRCDSLTGLGNRRAFRERVESEVERARRYGRDLSLIMLDADRFKQVNDTFGHQAGDRSLILLAELLQTSRRMEDGAFRIGGDEFALVLPETGQKGVTVVAERLRRRIEHAALGGERDIPLTVSIGVSSFGEHGINVDELFERADAALYEVKAAGGNAISLPPPSSGTTRLGVDIEKVIDGCLLEPFYQPIFDLKTGSVMAFEAFSRLEASHGFTPTPTLFRAASSVSRLEALDRLCRDVVLGGAADVSPDTLLFINVSPAALESDAFEVGALVASIEGTGMSIDRIVVEITEYERTPRSKRLIGNLNACRDAGLKVALDDFGAGGADLDLLAGSRFDYVKVDMSFVHGANGVETRRNVLRGLKLLATETGALTIAEGIETLDDLRLVQELEFTGAQGFLLREPSRVPDHSPRRLRLSDNVEGVPA